MSEIYIRVTNALNSSTYNITWKRVLVRKSLDEICHYIEVEIPEAERRNVHKHDKMQVMFKNKYLKNDSGTSRPVSTVYIDEIQSSIDVGSKAITIIGRSAARDIIDSQWSDMITGSPDLLTVVQTIAKRFNVKAIHMPENCNDTSAVYSFSWENESPWAKLLTEADAQGYMITSNQVGNLYLWKPASGVRTEGFAINEGVNITKLQITENGAEQFHEYIVRCNGKEGRTIDESCKNKRIMTINLSEFIFDQEKLTRRARTEMRRRSANKIMCTVSGWGLSDSHIQALGSTYQKEIFWETNFLIPVKLPSAGIDANMLISQVEYTADCSSVSCNITLVQPEAYQ